METRQEELLRLSSALIEQSKKYALARVESSRSFIAIKLELAKKLDEMKGDRKTFGYDMALIELRKNADDSLLKDFETYEIKEAEYKGLEKIIEAIKSRVMALQSVMKYDMTGEVGQHE